MKTLNAQLLTIFYLLINGASPSIIDWSKYKATDETVPSKLYTSYGTKPTFPLLCRRPIVNSNDFSQTDTTALDYSPTASYSQQGSNVQGNCDIIIGSGTKEETENDYKLENQLFPSVTSIGLTFDSQTKKLNLIKTITNTTDETMYINEIGLLYNHMVYIGSSTTSKAFLIFRKVLPSTYELKSNQSLNLILKQDDLSVEI